MLLLKHPRVEAREILRFSHPRVYHLHVLVPSAAHAAGLPGVREAFIVTGTAVTSPFVVVPKARTLVVSVSPPFVPVTAAGHGLTTLPLAAAADVVVSTVTMTTIVSAVLMIVIIFRALTVT